VNEEERQQDRTFWAGADAIARRLRLHLATLSLLGVVVSGAAALTMKAITKDAFEKVAAVRQDIASVRSEVAMLAALQRSREVADSTRYQKTLDIVGLAVQALVEPAGSEEQRAALSELRRRRRVIP